MELIYKWFAAHPYRPQTVKHLGSATPKKGVINSYGIFVLLQINTICIFASLSLERLLICYLVQ